MLCFRWQHEMDIILMTHHHIATRCAMINRQSMGLCIQVITWKIIVVILIFIWATTFQLFAIMQVVKVNYIIIFLVKYGKQFQLPKHNNETLLFHKLDCSRQVHENNPALKLPFKSHSFHIALTQTDLVTMYNILIRQRSLMAVAKMPEGLDGHWCMFVI